jgi:hypothetical protein
MELPLLATAALIGWEWLQRQPDIFGTFNAARKKFARASGHYSRSGVPIGAARAPIWATMR